MLLPAALVRREVGRFLRRQGPRRAALAYVYFEEEPGRRAAAFSPKTTPVCGFT
jgi:hypothetical protein